MEGWGDKEGKQMGMSVWLYEENVSGGWILAGCAGWGDAVP